ncbi:MAG: ATP-binding cassette domain-containing protein [Bacilli bacterium]|nr:ATP-binding cassette domain-containing protein [Bacilli bacterium]
MNLISCYKLSVGYENKKVVTDVNININTGDYLVIVGDNGSGKTTIVKTLLGLIKPLRGKISFNVEKNSIGYLPQKNEDKSNFPASVYEVVISGCLNSKKWLSFYNKSDAQRVNINLHKFGVAKLKNKNFKELSGGERQRVLLARAMCAFSKVLILDEPNTGLDQKTTRELYDLIEKINKEGITIIMISHDLDKTLKYANKILEVKEGKAIYRTKEQYLSGVNV